jgi:hypothetical protein
MLFDGDTIATKLASAGLLRLRRLIVWMGALNCVRAMELHAFSGSSFTSIVILRTIEILGSECFRWCESISSISMESDSLRR